jgi:hypothetical protein
LQKFPIVPLLLSSHVCKRSQLCHTLTCSLGCSHGIVFSFWVIKSLPLALWERNQNLGDPLSPSSSSSSSSIFLIKF